MEYKYRPLRHIVCISILLFSLVLPFFPNTKDRAVVKIETNTYSKNIYGRDYKFTDYKFVLDDGTTIGNFNPNWKFFNSHKKYYRRPKYSVCEDNMFNDCVDVDFINQTISQKAFIFSRKERNLLRFAYCTISVLLITICISILINTYKNYNTQKNRIYSFYRFFGCSHEDAISRTYDDSFLTNLLEIIN